MRVGFISLAMAALTLSSCASLQAIHANQDCNYGRDPAWRLTETPADAETYRQIARQHPSPDSAPIRPREAWFERADGAVKYCLISAAPLSCDTQSGTWWDFEPSEDGPRTDGANVGVCLT